MGSIRWKFGIFGGPNPKIEPKKRKFFGRFGPWRAYFLSDFAQIFFVSSGDHTDSFDTHKSTLEQKKYFLPTPNGCFLGVAGGLEYGVRDPETC